MAQEGRNVSHLMALKQAATAAPAQERAGGAEAVKGASVASAIRQPASGAEKRRGPRYKCEGSAEMLQDGIDLRTWATFTDISLHGCYVEATATYPVGTYLHMKLDAHGFRVHAKGTVRVSYPYLGMGIAFTEVSEEDRSRLRELLRSISQPSVILASGHSSMSSLLRRAESLPPVANAEAAIHAVIQFFEERQLLSREEFLRLLRRSQER
jgi:PilZ domain